MKMIKNLLTAFVILLALQSNAQNCGSISLDSIRDEGPYAVGILQQNDLRDGPGHGEATVYYPQHSPRRMAAVAIVPGFFSAKSTVEAWGPFLASHGIASIIFETNSLLDGPAERATGLLDALQTLRHADTSQASPLFGLIDTSRFGVMGWSMGGGGAQLAAATDSTLKAVIALCPWLNGPSMNDLDHKVPVFIFSGEVDPTAPPGVHANVHYNLTPNTTEKILFEVANGDHSIANDPANLQGEIGRYGLTWLRYNLLQDTCHCSLSLTPSLSTSLNLTSVVCSPVQDCPQTHQLFYQPIASGTYQAGVLLTTSSLIPQGGNVLLQSGQSIYLDPGFVVPATAELELKIEGCE